MLRAGLIGCGSISKAHTGGYAQIAEEKGGVVLEAVCDIRPEQLECFDDSVRKYTSVEEMLEKEQPDAVHICLPHYLHVPVAMDAFKKSFKNPDAAIAAGAALMAIGSVVSAGLQRLTANPVGGGSGASYGGAGSYGSSELTNYENTLTIEVTGKISGSDIVISGNKTNNKWNRYK